VLALLGVLSVAPIKLEGQQPTFRSTVDLVQVDIVVVDKDGKPIRGLTQADFTIRDRGKPQTIAAFQEIGRDARPAGTQPLMLPSVRLDVSSNQDARAERLVIMVIDDLHIWKSRTDRAKEISRDVVNRLGPESSMAVLFTSGEHNTNVTTDRSMLLTAVDTLKARQSWRRPHPAIDNQRVPHVDPEVDPTVRGGVLDQLSDAGANVTAQDFFDNMQQYGTLTKAAKMLGTEDVRRKAFVLVSEGIGKDLTGIFGAMTQPGDIPQGGQAYASGNLEAYAASSMANVPQLHTNAVLEMMEALRRANVATYAIDPRGEVKAGDLAGECFPPPHAGNDPCVDDSAGPNSWMSPVRQAQQGLVETAVATGGFAVTNTNDFTGGLSRILEDLDHYYLLGFYPADQSGKGYRPLTVQIAGHPEWTLRYRRGYMGGGKPEPPKNADPLVGLSAGILPTADLPLRLNAIAMPGSGDAARVVLALEVSSPVRALQGADGKIHDMLKYEVLLVDDKKAKVRSVGGLQGYVTLSPARPGQPPPDTVTYQVTHVLDVPPGRFEVRMSAESAKLGKGGSVYLDLDVPAFHTAATTLGTIAIGYAGGPRVPIAPTITSANGRGVQAAPASRLPLPFAPTLDRVFAPSDGLRVYVEGTARATADLTARIDVVNADGTNVASSTPLVAPGNPISIAGDVSLQGLQPGAYILRVTLSGGGQNAVRQAGFAIRP
jgi:VWFA-related protein